MRMGADGAAEFDTAAIAEGGAVLQPQPHHLHRQCDVEQYEHGEIAGGDRWQMHACLPGFNPRRHSLRKRSACRWGHRAAMNPESRDDTIEIPRCAIAHLRFALTRAPE
jgi:hypothetical protein